MIKYKCKAISSCTSISISIFLGAPTSRGMGDINGLTVETTCVPYRVKNAQLFHSFRRVGSSIFHRDFFLRIVFFALAIVVTSVRSFVAVQGNDHVQFN